ncbi:hypothetical protein GCK32_012963 [Trichostrongylus colubriformis]|uniref:ubiquitinyl hydrolase 1 n=1 Tax=Trichostrongylus colubriformis TaxID=6319 RepID=A0AAN8F4X4_TRICO
MYHERQSRQMCLVHALNALFQKPQFTSESLDEICYSLNESRWFNPHRFYNLDSKLDKPVEITDIVGYCRNLLAKTADANQIFLVGKDDPSGYVSTE